MGWLVSSDGLDAKRHRLNASQVNGFNLDCRSRSRHLVEVDLVVGAGTSVAAFYDLEPDAGGDGRAVVATGVQTMDLGAPVDAKGGTVDVVSTAGSWNSTAPGGAPQGVTTPKT